MRVFFSRSAFAIPCIYNSPTAASPTPCTTNITSQIPYSIEMQGTADTGILSKEQSAGGTQQVGRQGMNRWQVSITWICSTKWDWDPLCSPSLNLMQSPLFRWRSASVNASWSKVPSVKGSPQLPCLRGFVTITFTMSWLVLVFHKTKLMHRFTRDTFARTSTKRGKLVNGFHVQYIHKEPGT